MEIIVTAFDWSIVTQVLGIELLGQRKRLQYGIAELRRAHPEWQGQRLPGSSPSKSVSCWFAWSLVCTLCLTPFLSPLPPFLSPLPLSSPSLPLFPPSFPLPPPLPHRAFTHRRMISLCTRTTATSSPPPHHVPHHAPHHAPPGPRLK